MRTLRNAKEIVKRKNNIFRFSIKLPERKHPSNFRRTIGCDETKFYHFVCNLYNFQQYFSNYTWHYVIYDSNNGSMKSRAGVISRYI